MRPGLSPPKKHSQGFSYASIEFSGSAADIPNPTELLESAVKIFAPAKATVAMSVDMDDVDSSFGDKFHLPSGYAFEGFVSQKLPGGGSVSYFPMHVDGCVRAGSPKTVLDPAFLSGGTSSDSASGYASCSDPEA